MLTALEKAKQRGATIIAVNPLPEAGLMHFNNPQTPRGVILGRTQPPTTSCRSPSAKPAALFQAIGKHLIEMHAEHGGVLDSSFIDVHTSGYDAYAEHVAGLEWAELERATGLTEHRMRGIARAGPPPGKTIVCWAMGLTQHKHSVPMLRDIMISSTAGQHRPTGCGRVPRPRALERAG